MNNFSRRELLGAAALAGGLIALSTDAVLAQSGSAGGTGSGPYSLPPLPYDYADLEPYIDAQTMKIHHDAHHRAYVDGANAAIAELERIRQVGGEDIRRVRAVTDALQFNLSGHLLHDMFWRTMKRDGGGEPPADSDVARLIRRDFGAFGSFAAQFQAAAMQVQGSGWGLLVYEPASQRLLVTQVEKQQNSTVWCVPLLGVDVWEHAYYLKYQNRRAEYIKAFMNVIDWDGVQQRLGQALKFA